MRAFFRSPTLTRSDLASITGLSQPTISRAVRRLAADGWIDEGEPINGLVGRRPRQLEINRSAACAIGVDIGEYFIRGTLVDAGGEQRAFTKVESDADRGGEWTLDKAVRVIRGLLDRSGFGIDRLYGLVVGVPGIVHHGTGVVYETPHIEGWDGLPLGEMMANSLGVPRVLIENDSDLAALAEYALGAGVSARSLVYIALEKGIGAGIVLDGRMYRGHHNAAGEIAFLTDTEYWVPRSYRGLGYLESKIGGKALMEFVSELLGTGPFKDIETAAEAVIREGVRDRVVEWLLPALTIAVANVVSIIDPEITVLGGEVASIVPDLPRLLTERVARLTPFRARIVQSNLGAEATMIGAVAEAKELMHQRILALLGEKEEDAHAP